MRNLIRMAGQKVRDIDDAYASRLAEYIGSFSPEKNTIGQYLQLGAGFSAGAPATRKFEVDAENGIGKTLMNYGVPALNAGIRYGLPALGAVGTAKIGGGIYDAASEVQLFGEDGQTPETLPM